MKKSGYSPFLLVAIIAVLALGQFIFSKRHDIVVRNINKKSLTPIKKIQSSPLLNRLLSFQAVPTSAPQAHKEMGRERQYTEQELSVITEVSFKQLLKETEEALPLLADLKKLPSEALHHTPFLIIRAGKDLGTIKEILKINTSFEKEALVFYQRCAKNKKGVTSVRALCLTNLLEINKKNGVIMDTHDYPENIVELSKLVIDL